MHREMAAQYADTLEQWLKVKAAGEASRDRFRAAQSALPTLASQLQPTTIQ
jgi:hypothetical protein